jgi:uncharacterized protein YdhG (YjbR/CyaY superfamily)
MDIKVKKYFDKLELPQKKILENLREFIQKTAPDAEECMSYGVPAFKLNGKFVLYAAFKEHIGLYPTPSAIEKFKKELAKYQTSKGTIKFPLDKPLPYDLIEKIIKYKYNKLKFTKR